ncbi:MAG: hypothetical protein ACI4T9_01015 [Prevotella sp.]
MAFAIISIANAFLSDRADFVTMIIEDVMIIAMSIAATVWRCAKYPISRPMAETLKGALRPLFPSRESIFSELDRKRQEHRQALEAGERSLFEAIRAYVCHVMHPFIHDNDMIVCIIENIDKFHLTKQAGTLTAVSRTVDLRSIDVCHFAYNIGKRLKWNNKEIAHFAKGCFPDIMKDMEHDSIWRNLTKKGTCRIEIDKPDIGVFDFHYEKSAGASLKDVKDQA